MMISRSFVNKINELKSHEFQNQGTKERGRPPADALSLPASKEGRVNFQENR